MSKVLVIQAHPHTEDESLSIKLGKYFIEQYKNNNPQDTIIIRDLYQEEVPPLNDLTFKAWKNKREGQALNKQEQDTIQKHNLWLEEFINADKYVFINPMYNLFLPAEMKQYIDIVAVPRKAFKYTSHGPVGLLSDKKLVHIQAAGNVYHMPNHGKDLSSFDVGDYYLRAIMQLFGLDKQNIHSLYIEGVDKDPDQSENIIKQVKKQADQIIKDF